MAYLLALLAAFCFSAQGAFMVSFYRKMDPSSAATYRAVTLIFLTSPIFLFVSKQEWEIFLPNLWILFVAGIVASGSAILTAYINRFLPVAIASTYTTVINIIFSTLIGIQFLSDKLSLVQGMVLLVLMVLFLDLGRHAANKKVVSGHQYNYTLGISLAVVDSLIAASAFAILTHASRESSPLLTAYFWELAIALALAAAALSRVALGRGQSLQKIPIKEFLKIGLAASPTPIAIVAITYAVTMESLGIVMAISGTSMVFLIFWGKWLYNEHLHRRQIISILLIFGCLVLLKLSESS